MDLSLGIQKVRRYFLLKKTADSLMVWHFPKLSSTSEQLLSVASSFKSLDKSNTTLVVDHSLLIAVYLAESDRKLQLTSLLFGRRTR